MGMCGQAVREHMREDLMIVLARLDPQGRRAPYPPEHVDLVEELMATSSLATACPWTTDRVGATAILIVQHAADGLPSGLAPL